MSVEGKIVRTVTAVALGVTVGCSEIKPILFGTPTLTATPTSTPTATLPPPDIERTRVAPLLTPKVMEEAVISTSEAFIDTGWGKMIERGFPPEAIYSAVGIEILASSQIENEVRISETGGSGNVMHIEGYWVVLTARHVLTDIFGTGDIQNITFTRGVGLPNRGKIKIYQREFGIATTGLDEPDFGVIVIPDFLIISMTDDMFNPNSALRKEQIYFGPVVKDSYYYGLCFPEITDGKPDVAYEARLPNFVDQPDARKIILGNDLSQPGCSGGGMFVKDGGDFLYVGPSISIYKDHELLAGVTNVANLGSLGEKGFDNLIQSAIEDFEAKNGK